MSEELANEFVGKVCSILSDNSFGIQGKVVSVSGNWIKVEQKNNFKLLNLDYVTSIEILPEKYQK